MRTPHVRVSPTNARACMPGSNHPLGVCGGQKGEGGAPLAQLMPWFVRRSSFGRRGPLVRCSPAVLRARSCFLAPIPSPSSSSPAVLLVCLLLPSSAHLYPPTATRPHAPTRGAPVTLSHHLPLDFLHRLPSGAWRAGRRPGPGVLLLQSRRRRQDHLELFVCVARHSPPPVFFFFFYHTSKMQNVGSLVGGRQNSARELLIALCTGHVFFFCLQR